MNHKLTHFQGVMQVQQIQEPTRLKKKKHDTSKRGKVSHFSRKSRRNLLNKILKLEHRDGYYFVTLTYQENDKAFTEWKKNLNHFYCSLQYHYPKMGFLWKLEFQKRGTPHFHLLLFDPTTPSIKELRSLVKEHWYKIVGMRSKEFRHHGTDTQVVKNIKQSGFYLAMYQLKDANEPMDILKGRTWGVKGSKNMPFTEFGNLELDEHSYTKFKRVIRKWMDKQKNSRGYSIYLKNRFGSFNVFLPVCEQVRLVKFVKDSIA